MIKENDENVDKVDYKEIIDELKLKNNILMIVLTLIMIVLFVFFLSKYLEPM